MARKCRREDDDDVFGTASSSHRLYSNAGHSETMEEGVSSAAPACTTEMTTNEATGIRMQPFFMRLFQRDRGEKSLFRMLNFLVNVW